MNDENIERSALLIGGAFTSHHPILRTFGEMRFCVETIGSGEEAVRVLRRKQPDLVVIDTESSGIDFVSLCQQIRRFDQLVSLPVVLLFDYGPNEAQAFLALEAGVDNWFTSMEPFEQFSAKVEWLLNRRHSALVAKQYHDELRHRHEQTLDLVRATSNLMESIDFEFRERRCEEDPDCADLMGVKLNMGLDIVRSLASILEQQSELLYRSHLQIAADHASRGQNYREMGLNV